MNYFKNNNNQIFAYDDEQVAQGYGKNLISITEAEMNSIVNPPKTAEQLIQEAKQNFVKKVQAHIDNAMTTFNATHGVSFESLANMDSAGNRIGYSLQAECKAFADWAYITVWDSMRAWEKTLTSIPTDAEFQAKLDTVAYNG